jgi:beta-lactamase class A
MTGVTVVWAHDRFTPAPAGNGLQALQQLPVGTPELDANSAQPAVAPGASDAPAAPETTLAQDAAVDGTPDTTPRPATTPVATLRRWDTAASDVQVEPLLVGQLDQALAGIEGTVSIAVKDLGSGRGAVLDGSREMQAASLFKLPVLYTVFEAGVPLGESLLITEEARSYDLGTMELGVGETLTVAEALERMVTISDTTSALMLAGRVGSARITRDIAAVGMDTTHYSLERMTTSSLDMLDLLELIARGRAVSPAASADMLHLLLRQKVNDRLPRLLPDDVRVAHKTGNLPGIVNDVGILYGPNSTVVVAALVSDTSNEAAAAAAIARVGLIASSYFEAQPNQHDRPQIPPPPARAVPPVWREPRPTPTPTEVPTPEPAVPEPSPTAVTPATATAAARPTSQPPTASPTRPAAAVPAATTTSRAAQAGPTATSVAAKPTATPKPSR